MKLKDSLLNFFVKYGLVFGGVFVLVISLIVIRNGYIDKKISEENDAVKVRVIECSETSRNNFFFKFKLNDNDKVFIKRTKRKYCEIVNDLDEIKMLANQDKSRFVFVGEYDNNNNILYGLALLILSLVIIIKGGKRE